MTFCDELKRHTTIVEGRRLIRDDFVGAAPAAEGRVQTI